MDGNRSALVFSQTSPETVAVATGTTAHVTSPLRNWLIESDGGGTNPGCVAVAIPAEDKTTVAPLPMFPLVQLPVTSKTRIFDGQCRCTANVELSGLQGPGDLVSTGDDAGRHGFRADELE